MDNQHIKSTKHLERHLSVKAWSFVGVFLLALHALPWFAPNLIHTMIMIFLMAIMGQGWNVLSGYAGQFSFGHSLFFGLGAYTSTLLFVKLGISPWFGIAASIVVAIFIGLIIGYLSFRFGLEGPFFALIMLAFAEIFHLLVMGWELAGGAEGILIPLKGNAPYIMQFLKKEPFYFLLIWLTVASIFLVWKMEGTRMGLYLQAIREDNDAAEALGVNSLRYKLYAMAISAGMTAVGGTIYAQYLLYIDPDTTFGIINSVEILLRPIVGGTGTVLGPLLGSFVLTPLAEITRDAFQAYSGVYLMIYGALLVVVIIYLPDGIMGVLKKVMAQIKSKGATS